MRQRPYSNRVVTAGIVLAALFIVSQAGQWLNSAGAAPPRDDEPKVPFNAAEQRKLMIVQLEQMNDRLKKIESALSAGINVKVTDMPAVKVMDNGGSKE